MENKDVSRFRDFSDKEIDEEYERRKSNRSSDDGERSSARDDKELDASDDGSEERSGERVLSEAEQREAELREIDSTEISNDAETSTLYRRAVSDFDPKETKPQVAEYWHFTDAEFERDGHF